MSRCLSLSEGAKLRVRGPQACHLCKMKFLPLWQHPWLLHPQGPRSHGALSSQSQTPSQREGFRLKSGSCRTTAEFREVFSCFFSSFLLSPSVSLCLCLSLFLPKKRKEWNLVTGRRRYKVLSGRGAGSHNRHPQPGYRVNKTRSKWKREK